MCDLTAWFALRFGPWKHFWQPTWVRKRTVKFAIFTRQQFQLVLNAKSRDHWHIVLPTALPQLDWFKITFCHFHLVLVAAGNDSFTQGSLVNCSINCATALCQIQDYVCAFCTLPIVRLIWTLELRIFSQFFYQLRYLNCPNSRLLFAIFSWQQFRLVWNAQTRDHWPIVLPNALPPLDWLKITQPWLFIES